MPIGPSLHKQSFGRRCATVTMLRILKSARARCTAGELRSTPPWLIHGIAQLACRATLTISRLGMWRYTGRSFEVLGHVRLLQWAMHKAGFWGMRRMVAFYIVDWKKFLPEEARQSAHVQGTQ